MATWELPTPDGFEWVGQFGMDRVDWADKIRVADIRSVDIHPSGLWAVVDMGDTTAWIRIPADVTSVQWERQADLRELDPAPSTTDQEPTT